MNHARGFSVALSVVIVAILAATAAAFYVLQQREARNKLPDIEIPPATLSIQSPTVTWKYAAASSTDPAMPMTQVSATINGTDYTIGTYPGSCNEIDAAGGIDGKGLLANEMAATQCYFAGGGIEIGVYVENGKMYIKKGELSEGDAETPFFRGNFTTMISL